MSVVVGTLVRVDVAQEHAPAPDLFDGDDDAAAAARFLNVGSPLGSPLSQPDDALLGELPAFDLDGDEAPVEGTPMHEAYSRDAPSDDVDARARAAAEGVASPHSSTSRNSRRLRGLDLVSWWKSRLERKR